MDMRTYRILDSSSLRPGITKKFTYLKWRVSRIHKPALHTAYIGEDEPSILGTNEMFGEMVIAIYQDLFR